MLKRAAGTESKRNNFLKGLSKLKGCRKEEQRSNKMEIS